MCTCRDRRSGGWCPRLDAELGGSAADVLQRPSDRKPGGADVDVGPFEADDLAAPHSRVRGEMQRPVETLLSCRLKKLFELGCDPALRSRSIQDSWSRQLRDPRDVVVDEVTLHGEIECASDDDVGLVHRLGRQPVAAASSRGEQLSVEVIEVVRAQVTQHDGSRRWG